MKRFPMAKTLDGATKTDGRKVTVVTAAVTYWDRETYRVLAMVGNQIVFEATYVQPADLELVETMAKSIGERTP